MSSEVCEGLTRNGYHIHVSPSCRAIIQPAAGEESQELSRRNSSHSRPALVSLRRSDSSLANELSAAGNFQRPRASSQASKAISGRCRHWPVDWVWVLAVGAVMIGPAESGPDRSWERSRSLF
jgi:hypothetical protein